MLFDGGDRRLQADGSIELLGRRRMVTGPMIASFLASWAMMIVIGLCWEDSPVGPLVVLVWPILMLALARVGTRRVLFDTSRKVLYVRERRWRREVEHELPFSDIREVKVEQREPRFIANAPPVLTVNGKELLSVKRSPVNEDLERELQALLGLPLRPSPRDTSAWSAW